jgi:hypothetical protein
LVVQVVGHQGAGRAANYASYDGSASRVPDPRAKTRGRVIQNKELVVLVTVTAGEMHNETDNEVAAALAEARRRDARHQHLARRTPGTFSLCDCFELPTNVSPGDRRIRVIVFERKHGRLNTSELVQKFGLTQREAEVTRVRKSDS